MEKLIKNVQMLICLSFLLCGSLSYCSDVPSKNKQQFVPARPLYVNSHGVFKREIKTAAGNKQDKAQVNGQASEVIFQDLDTGNMVPPKNDAFKKKLDNLQETRQRIEGKKSNRRLRYVGESTTISSTIAVVVSVQQQIIHNTLSGNGSQPAHETVSSSGLQKPRSLPVKKSFIASEDIHLEVSDSRRAIPVAELMLPAQKNPDFILKKSLLLYERNRAKQNETNNNISSHQGVGLLVQTPPKPAFDSSIVSSPKTNVTNVIEQARQELENNTFTVCDVTVPRVERRRNQYRRRLLIHESDAEESEFLPNASNCMVNHPLIPLNPTRTLKLFTTAWAESSSY